MKLTNGNYITRNGTQVLIQMVQIDNSEYFYARGVYLENDKACSRIWAPNGRVGNISDGNKNPVYHDLDIIDKG